MGHVLSDEDVGSALSLSNKRARILAFTGAGVSAASGLPVFRGSEGIFKKRYKLASALDLLNYDQVFTPYLQALRKTGRADTKALEAFYSFVGDFRLKALDAKPNRFHRIIAKLAQEGRIIRLITSNIDGLDERAGVPADVLVQMHGTLSELICVACNEVTPFTRKLASDAGAGAVLFHVGCPRARGSSRRPGSSLPVNLWRPRVLLYGQDPLNGTFLPDKWPRIGKKTAMIVAGASLAAAEMVSFVKGFATKVRDGGGRVIIANQKRIAANLGPGVEHWMGDLRKFPFGDIPVLPVKGVKAKKLTCRRCTKKTRAGRTCKSRTSCRLGCRKSCFRHASRHKPGKSCQD
jgi:NAD-dependent SIR2 family protein deacetylase